MLQNEHKSLTVKNCIIALEIITGLKHRILVGSEVSEQCEYIWWCSALFVPVVFYLHA
jgi:hypothetical protein